MMDTIAQKVAASLIGSLRDLVIGFLSGLGLPGILLGLVVAGLLIKPMLKTATRAVRIGAAVLAVVLLGGAWSASRTTPPPVVPVVQAPVIQPPAVPLPEPPVVERPVIQLPTFDLSAIKLPELPKLVDDGLLDVLCIKCKNPLRVPDTTDVNEHIRCRQCFMNWDVPMLIKAKADDWTHQENMKKLAASIAKTKAEIEARAERRRQGIPEPTTPSDGPTTEQTVAAHKRLLDFQAEMKAVQQRRRP